MKGLMQEDDIIEKYSRSFIKNISGERLNSAKPDRRLLQKCMSRKKVACESGMAVKLEKREWT